MMRGIERLRKHYILKCTRFILDYIYIYIFLFDKQLNVFTQREKEKCTLLISPRIKLLI